MAVFIFEKDALNKMALIEGERWLRHQSDTNLATFAAFKEAWYSWFQAAKANNAEILQESDMQHACLVDQGIVDQHNNGAIYGDGGWTRYTVRLSGEILFIKDFSPSAEIAQKAKEAGFNLF